jgi:hypothetical protein
MNAHRLLVILALSAFLGLSSAHAQPVVYDVNAGPGHAKGLGVGSGTLDIYIDPGTDQTFSGTLCEDGDGDELCAADVKLTLTGPGEITAFQKPMTGPDVVFEPMSFPPGVTTIRLNLLQATSPPSPPVPQYLGTLTVDVFAQASTANPVKITATGQAVDAGGTLMGIPSFLVPEPSGFVLLLSGALGLAALHWLRTRGACVAASGGTRDTR